MDGGVDEKRMRLRYAGVCRVCQAELSANAPAVYERSSKTVRCLDHEANAPTHEIAVEGIAPAVVDVVESGTAGASARREIERRNAKCEERIRSNRPKLGELIITLSEGRQSATAWGSGAVGE